MANITNSLVKNNQKPKFSVAIQSEGYKNLINNTLRDPKRANRFVANIMSAVATNPMLSDCDAGTILSAGLLGESLNLSPSAQLGQFYLVPFNDKTRGKVATFQIGWKGYYQLALRSGYYKKLNALPIKKGELIRFNPLEEEIEVRLIEDDTIREQTETIGYYAFFEYNNGFKKAIYWSKEKMEQHALKYSQGYRADKKNNTEYTFWSKSFDDQALKTMYRQLISKFGIMSTEMQEAYVKDQAVIDEKGNVDYVDNDNSDLFVTDTQEVVEEPKEELTRQQSLVL